MKIEIDLSGKVLQEYERMEKECPSWDSSSIVEYLILKSIVKSGENLDVIEEKK